MISSLTPTMDKEGRRDAKRDKFDRDKPVLKQGFLMKRAQGKSLLGRMNWKPRLFLLQDSALSWWDDDGRNKGLVDTARITAVEKVNDVIFKKQFTFQVVHSAILYIHCRNEVERDEWMRALREQVMANGTMHPTFHPGCFDGKTWTCCNIPSQHEKGCEPAFNYGALLERTSRLASAASREDV